MPGRRGVFSWVACRYRPIRPANVGELERVRGIEPLYAAWEAAVLPLNYTRSGVDSNFVPAAVHAASACCSVYSPTFTLPARKPASQ